MYENHLSKSLKIKMRGHKDIDFVDVALAPDTELFIDPCLIEVGNTQWCKSAQKTIDSFFDALYLSYRQPTNRSSTYKLLQHLGERNEARLGYGNGDNGKGNTAEGMMEILADVPMLIARGIQMDDPIDLPLFISDFAEDGMSDMLVNILYKELSEFTVQQCQKYGISTCKIDAVRYYWDVDTASWQCYSGDCLKVEGKISLLIPKGIVRKGYYYNTSQYLNSVIVSRIQEEKTVCLNGKEVAPRKKDIYAEECKTYGSVIEAARVRTLEDPSALSFYHSNMKVAYSGRGMTDEELDDFVYGKSDG